jgi:ribosomal protein S18 acetylase RimI-like enzyme
MIVVLEHQKQEQAERICEVLRAGYRAEAALIGVEDFPPLRRTAADVAGSVAEFLGFLRPGGLVAVAEVLVAATRDVELASLSVDPRVARTGIGSALVRAVLARHAGRDCVVSTATDNLPAIRLYERLDFRIRSNETTPEGIRKVILVRSAAPALAGSGVLPPAAP